MPPLLKQLLPIFGYIAFGVGSFMFFAYWMFPYNHLREFIIQEVERPMAASGTRRPSGYHLEIDDLSPTLFGGLDLKGVRFSKESTDPESRPTPTLFDDMDLGVSFFGLLFGQVNADFELNISDGTIEGELELSEEETHIEVTFTDVDLRRIGIFTDLAGLPITGKLNGTVDLTVAKDNANTHGEFALSIANMLIGAEGAKIAGLTIGRVNAGTLTMNATVERGTVRFTRFASDGRDLQLRVGGSVRLLQPLTTSTMDLLINVKFTEAFRTRDERTTSMFSLLDMNPAMRQARTPDGALQWSVQIAPNRPLHYSPAGRTAAPR